MFEAQAEFLVDAAAATSLEVAIVGVIKSFLRPQAIGAMKEMIVDISGYRSRSAEEFVGRNLDYLGQISNLMFRCNLNRE